MVKCDGVWTLRTYNICHVLLSVKRQLLFLISSIVLQGYNGWSIISKIERKLNLGKRGPIELHSV